MTSISLGLESAPTLDNGSLYSTITNEAAGLVIKRVRSKDIANRIVKLLPDLPRIQFFLIIYCSPLLLVRILLIIMRQAAAIPSPAIIDPTGNPGIAPPIGLEGGVAAVPPVVVEATISVEVENTVLVVVVVKTVSVVVCLSVEVTY